MEREILRRLKFYYYTMMTLGVLAAGLGYYLVMKDVVVPFDPMSSFGQTLQSVLIIALLVTVPYGLWQHKRNCKRLSRMENKEEQVRGYEMSAMLRILLVGSVMPFALLAFYLLGCYQSMLWIAGISAIALYFAKPTEGKMQQELLPTE